MHCFLIFIGSVNSATGVKMKIWFNVTHGSVDNLYRDPRYPDNPDNVKILSSFDTGQKLADNYGCKLSALYKVKRHSIKLIIFLTTYLIHGTALLG